MKRIILLLIVLISLSANYLFPQHLPEDPAKGVRLFASKGCVKCHSLKGEGGKTGPDFGRIDLGESQLDLATKLWNHIPSMIDGMERVKIIKPKLTGEEFSAISAYLYFLKFFDESGNPIRGRSVFNEKGCSLCHPLSGKGKRGEKGLDAFPQNLSSIFLSQVIWNHGADMIAEMVRLGMKWPEFKDTEMMDLLEYIKQNAKGGTKEASYITPGNPKEGRNIFIKKGCIKCHSIKGEGGKNGEDLGRKAKQFYKSLTEIASIMWNKGPSVLSKMLQTETGIPKFTAKEMADLISYLYFLHFIDDPGNPLNGKKIYTQLGCSKCHGVDGKQGELMQIDLSKYEKTQNPMDIVAGIWNHGEDIERAIRGKGLSWPRLKKGEMADILEYIRMPKAGRDIKK